MKTEIIDLLKCKTNKANPRLIKDDNFLKLINSILVFPKMMDLRPIVVDRSLTILGGNMRYKALTEIADYDNDELRGQLSSIASFVKKTKDEKDALISYWERWQDKPTATIINASYLTDDEQRQFIIKDNVGYGEWDMDMLENDWDKIELESWGIDLWESMHKDDDNPIRYTNRIECPTYETKNEKPPIAALYTESKYTELIAKIEKTNIPEEDKQFLRIAAQRHVVFNYERIADYYANSTKEVQDLMEDSALVIIDLNKAIADGYVALSDKIQKIQKEDYGDEE